MSELIRLDEAADVMAKFTELRKAAGLTQYAVAPLARMEQTNLSRLEGGHHYPSLETAFRLFHALGYDLALVPKEWVDVIACQ